MGTSKAYDDGLIKELQDPLEAAAYLRAALEEKDYASLKLAVNKDIDNGLQEDLGRAIVRALEFPPIPHKPLNLRPTSKGLLHAKQRNGTQSTGDD